MFLDLLTKNMRNNLIIQDFWQIDDTLRQEIPRLKQQNPNTIVKCFTINEEHKSIIVIILHCLLFFLQLIYYKFSDFLLNNKSIFSVFFATATIKTLSAFQVIVWKTYCSICVSWIKFYIHHFGK